MAREASMPGQRRPGWRGRSGARRRGGDNSSPSRGLRFVQPALINGSVGLILAPGGMLSRALTDASHDDGESLRVEPVRYLSVARGLLKLAVYEVSPRPRPRPSKCCFWRLYDGAWT